MHPDDATAVALARDGDEAAFRLLVERHSRGIYRMAFRMAGRHEDAEDVVQETFVRAYRQLGRFESRANFSTWLYRIGFNCAVDYLRSRRARETPEAPETLDRRTNEHDRPSMDDLVYAGQVNTKIEAVLGDLTTQERTAFVMRHFHGCSIDEIASTLDVKDNAAKHAVFRAVKKMRAALRPLMHVKLRVL